MKVIKKICVYLLVGLLTCTSVAVSYQKANSCEAGAIGLGIGLGVLALATLTLGVYYVSTPEAREEAKEALSNYKDMTAEAAKAEELRRLLPDVVVRG